MTILSQDKILNSPLPPLLYLVSILHVYFVHDRDHSIFSTHLSFAIRNSSRIQYVFSSLWSTTHINIGCRRYHLSGEIGRAAAKLQKSYTIKQVYNC